MRRAERCLGSGLRLRPVLIHRVKLLERMLKQTVCEVHIVARQRRINFSSGRTPRC